MSQKHEKNICDTNKCLFQMKPKIKQKRESPISSMMSENKSLHKTIADMEFEKMYDETSNYLQQHLTFSSSSQEEPISFKRNMTANTKRVSFSAEINYRKVERLYENDIERENLWWSASNKIEAADSKCLERFWKSDSIYRWTIDQQAWVYYDDELTRVLCEEILSNLITKLNENDLTSE